MVLVISFQVVEAKQECRLEIYPGYAYIPRDAAFVLEACNCDGTSLKDLGKETLVFVYSENGDTVQLSQLEYHKGEGDIEQVFLRPERSLIAGQKYRFISNAFAANSEFSGKTQRRYFTVQDYEAEPVSAWAKQPHIVMAYHGRSNEFLHSLYQVQANLKEEAVIWFKVSVRNMRTGNSGTWLQFQHNMAYSLLQIGIAEDACQTWWYFNKEDKYEITLLPLNLAGQPSPTSKVIITQSPQKLHAQYDSLNNQLSSIPQEVVAREENYHPEPVEQLKTWTTGDQRWFEYEFKSEGDTRVADDETHVTWRFWAPAGQIGWRITDADILEAGFEYTSVSFAPPVQYRWAETKGYISGGFSQEKGWTVEIDLRVPYFDPSDAKKDGFLKINYLAK